ncbi:hypothetical protein SFR_0646 [Streptomyces sp. FR-008]|nr:hypothetical protein SFR_0646 [Streptomyces sp. FR-008]
MCAAPPPGAHPALPTPRVDVDLHVGRSPMMAA